MANKKKMEHEKEYAEMHQVMMDEATINKKMMYNEELSDLLGFDLGLVVVLRRRMIAYGDYAKIKAIIPVQQKLDGARKYVDRTNEKMRTCLANDFSTGDKCGKSFLSHSAGNRRCPTCSEKVKGSKGDGGVNTTQTYFVEC